MPGLCLLLFDETAGVGFADPVGGSLPVSITAPGMACDVHAGRCEGAGDEPAFYVTHVVPPGDGWDGRRPAGLAVPAACAGGGKNPGPTAGKTGDWGCPRRA